MKRVYSAGSPVEASLAKDLLASNGINAIVQGDMLWSVRGELPMTTETSPSVWVRGEDFERAKKLIADWESNEAPAGDSWICKACNETNEGQFFACWKCSAVAVEGQDLKMPATQPATQPDAFRQAEESVSSVAEGAQENLAERALLTISVVMLCLVLFAQVPGNLKALSWLHLARLGLVSADQIWSGKYWGILTSNFVHIDLWIFAFSVGWFWFLGRRIELRRGHSVLLAVIVVSALITEAASLLFHSMTFPGLTGVTFGLLGFAWATGDLAAKRNEKTVALIQAAFMVSLVTSFMGARIGGPYTLNVGLPLSFLTGLGLGHVLVLRKNLVGSIIWFAVALTAAVVSILWVP